MRRSSRAVARMLWAWSLVVAGCSRDPSTITIEVVGSPRPDWAAAVAPCLDPSWDWQLDEGQAGERVAIRVDGDDYDDERGVQAVRCLMRQPGITHADIPAKQ